MHDALTEIPSDYTTSVTRAISPFTRFEYQIWNRNCRCRFLEAVFSVTIDPFHTVALSLQRFYQTTFCEAVKLTTLSRELFCFAAARRNATVVTTAPIAIYAATADRTSATTATAFASALLVTIFCAYSCF